MEKITRLSTVFSELEKTLRQKDVTVLKLLEYLEEKGGCLAALLLSFPFLLPIPLPGLSIPFGIIIVLSGVEFLIGHWYGIPRSLLNKNIQSNFFAKVFEKGQKFLVKMERLIKPRLFFFVFFPGARAFQALIIMTGGFLLSLPLPPGTNAPPAAMVFFVALGVLEEDGVCSLIGYFLFLLNIAFFSALGFLGYEGVIKLLEKLH